MTANLHEPALTDYFRARAAQHTEDWYVGVPISKFPEDLRIYEHLLWLDRVDAVIELGTQFGGSALWFRDRLACLRGYGRITPSPLVVTVDLDLQWARRTRAETGNFDGIHLVEGALDHPEVVRRVAELVAGRRCLVVEDSAHTFETTTAALTWYTQFVPQGGFMVVEDGCVDDEVLRLPDWTQGVRPAISQWLHTSAGSTFEVRHDLELYGVTCHPGGFLQRVG